MNILFRSKTFDTYPLLVLVPDADRFTSRRLLSLRKVGQTEHTNYLLNTLFFKGASGFTFYISILFIPTIPHWLEIPQPSMLLSVFYRPSESGEVEPVEPWGKSESGGIEIPRSKSDQSSGGGEEGEQDSVLI